MRYIVILFLILSSNVFAADQNRAEVIDLDFQPKIDALNKEVADLKARSSNISKEGLDLILATEKQFNLIISGIFAIITAAIGWMGKLSRQREQNRTNEEREQNKLLFNLLMKVLTENHPQVQKMIDALPVPKTEK